jgi:hypothetical protein
MTANFPGLGTGTSIKTNGEVKQYFIIIGLVWFMGFNTTFNNISVISCMAVRFIVGGNRSTRRKPPTCCKTPGILDFKLNGIIPYEVDFKNLLKGLFKEKRKEARSTL